MIRPINFIEVEIHILVVVVTNQSIEVFCDIDVQIVTGVARGRRQLARGDVYVTDGEPPITVLLPSRSVSMHLDVDVDSGGLLSFCSHRNVDILVGISISPMPNRVFVASFRAIADGQLDGSASFVGDSRIASFIIIPAIIVGAVTLPDLPDIVIPPVARGSLNRGRLTR